MKDYTTFPSRAAGGFFVRAALPESESAGDLLEHAIANKIIYVAGRAFFVNGEGDRFPRLSFSYPRTEQIVEGIQRLAAVVNAQTKIRA